MYGITRHSDPDSFVLNAENNKLHPGQRAVHHLVWDTNQDHRSSGTAVALCLIYQVGTIWASDQTHQISPSRAVPWL